MDFGHWLNVTKVMYPGAKEVEDLPMQCKLQEEKGDRMSSLQGIGNCCQIRYAIASNPRLFKD
jgi:hypothetical protein